MRRILVVGGAALMAYAVWGALGDPDVAPLGVLVFLAGVLVAHDGVWMPVLLGVGALTRRVPDAYRGVLRAGTIVLAALAVVGLPLVLSPGRPADNPSVLPLHYGRNLSLLLLLVAVAIGARLVGKKSGGAGRQRRKDSARTLSARDGSDVG